MTTHPEVRAAVQAGLDWLYITPQPDTAVISHLGETVAARGANRMVSFTPRGSGKYPVIVVEVGEVEYPDSDIYAAPANPIGPAELDDLVVTLTGLGATVKTTWNGHPGTTGSVALDRPAHPTLLSAVDRYHAGCPTHPGQGVFCGCGWIRASGAVKVAF